MLALKVDYRNYQVYVNIVTIVKPTEEIRPKKLINATFVVIHTKEDATPGKIEYYDNKDFHKNFKWVLEAKQDAFAKVVPIDNTEDD